jgi:heat shock protein HtpX
MPKLYITPARQANAFATGRDPSHASVAVTSGILEVLSRDELRGVLAHELGHVKNRDILIATIAAVLASAISFLGNMAIYNPSSRDDDNGGGVFALIAAIMVPIAASLIQLAVSRQREFAADELGAKTIGNGNPLADALLAISDTTKRSPMKTNPAFSSLYIENPFGDHRSNLINLFSTHPPVEERVKRLRAIK